MFDHERRPLALPSLPHPEVTGRKPRRRWRRPDAPRPQANPRPAPLPSPEAVVPELDAPEPLTRTEVTALLSAPARLDLRAASLAGTTGGRS